MVRKTCSLLHKKCKLGAYVVKKKPKNANVICKGPLSEPIFNPETKTFFMFFKKFENKQTKFLILGGYKLRSIVELLRIKKFENIEIEICKCLSTCILYHISKRIQHE